MSVSAHHPGANHGNGRSLLRSHAQREAARLHAARGDGPGTVSSNLGDDRDVRNGLRRNAPLLR